MPANARQYRDHLYRNRSHPHGAPPTSAAPAKESFTGIQLSILPFLILEYLAELSYESLPSGLVFPVGFLIFWAFYYTYYRPGYLEERLSSKSKWEKVGIPSILVGVAIWCIKIVVVELTETILVRGFSGKQKPKSAQGPHRPEQAHASSPPRTPPDLGLPPDVTSALGILGLPNCRDWDTIHRRYRQLAKQNHPDLNPDQTQAGRRFMMYDSAYRKLAGVKGKYFSKEFANSRLRH